MSDLQPHELQHIRLPCPLLSLWDCPNSCPLSKWCHPTISSSVIPSLVLNIFQHQGLSNESALHFRWPKYWSFSFSTSLSNEYTGLISFRIDWSDFLAVQRILKSLLQHYSSKASILQHSVFFCFVFCFFFLWSNSQINLDSVLKSRDITFLTKVSIVKWWELYHKEGW